MRLLTLVAVALVMLMSAATVAVIADSPDHVDEVPTRQQPTPNGTQTPVTVAVVKGESVADISEALEDADVIQSAVQFRVLVALLGYDRSLQAGEYEFDAGTPALQAVYRMRQGALAPFFVTVVEGWRLEQVADAVAAEGTILREEFLDAAVVGEYASEFEFLGDFDPETSLEGYLFPATYYYGRNTTASELVGRMLAKMDESFTPELRASAEDAGLSMHEVLTLASIIEREAVVAEERPIMAQVFLKRLRLGIPLEADPTVQYALAEDPQNVADFGYWKTELTLADLEVDSPYNTYRVTGLPPGPTSAPRLDSITAVIEPAGTNYLYFVAKPDGSHAFAETFEEHQSNVEEFAP